jgi:uncharacterized membrane protein
MLFRILLAVGVLLRVRDYLVNRSLWLDEAWLALNVLGKSTADLVLKRLDFNQAAPPGFLFLVKLGVLAWGGSEYVLRLVPLLFSLASLLLFAWIARRVLAPAGALVAMALFAFLPPLIRYAAEFKQYGVDVTVGLGVIAAVLPFLDGPAGRLHAVMLCLTGAAAVWLSHPAPFFLAAAGLALLVQRRRQRQPAIGTLIAIGAIWVASFLFVYLVSLRDLGTHQGLQRAWASTFPPSVFSLSAIRWTGSHIMELLVYAFGSRAPLMGMFAVLAGCVSLLIARPVHLALLIAPMGLALVAALLGRYPFQDRLVLFALPLLALLAGGGAEYVRRSTRDSRVITVLFIGLLLFSPAFAASSHLIRPQFIEESRPVIAYVQRHTQPDDVVYLSYSAQPAFWYHAPRLGFRPRRVVLGTYDREAWPEIAADLAQLRGRGRAWVVLSHFTPAEEQFVRYYLDTLGTKQDSFTALRAVALLYDLR